MSAPQTPGREQEIRARAEAATPGPWGTYADGTGLIDIAADLKDTGHGYQCRRYIGQLESDQIDNDPAHADWDEDQDREQEEADAEFIAHAREDIPWLLDRVAELETLELGSVDGRVSASCENPDHPTWLRKLNDLRGCPWCRVAELEGAAACPSVAAVGDFPRCVLPVRHHGDHRNAASNHFWSDEHAAAVASPAREQGETCTSEYGGPGYTHCELAHGHPGQHESGMGNMHRATWGEAR